MEKLHQPIIPSKVVEDLDDAPAALTTALADPDFARWHANSVAPHKAKGHAIVTLSLKPVGGPPGDATADQMDAIADLAAPPPSLAESSLPPRPLAKQPLLLARRSGWKAPKPGTGYAATRGELYAYDVAAKRYLRVTHTDHSLAGYLRGPSGELLLVGFSQAEVPDPAKAPKTAAPTLTRSSPSSRWRTSRVVSPSRS